MVSLLPTAADRSSARHLLQPVSRSSVAITEIQNRSVAPHSLQRVPCSVKKAEVVASTEVKNLRIAYEKDAGSGLRNSVQYAASAILNPGRFFKHCCSLTRSASIRGCIRYRCYACIFKEETLNVRVPPRFPTYRQEKMTIKSRSVSERNIYRCGG